MRYRAPYPVYGRNRILIPGSNSQIFLSLMLADIKAVRGNSVLVVRQDFKILPINFMVNNAHGWKTDKFCK